MIFIDTVVAPSTTNNLGLFAAQDIEQGTIIWKYHPSTCMIITHEQINVMKNSFQDALTSSIQHFGCPYKHGFLVHTDNMRYINHNDNPNTICIDDDTMIAMRYIFCGEELFEDYN